MIMYININTFLKKKEKGKKGELHHITKWNIKIFLINRYQGGGYQLSA